MVGAPAPSVIVVGAGVVGAAIARDLVRAGHAVTVFDKGPAGGAVSGGSLACIGAHMIDDAEFPLLLGACDAWADFARTSATGFEYRRCGQLRFVEKPGDLAGARACVDKENAAGLPVSFLEPGDIPQVEPALTGPLLGASHDPGAAMVNPFLAVRALLREARDHGAEIRVNRPVAAVRETGGRVRGVALEDGSVAEAERVVLACGPWTARLAATAGAVLALRPRRAQCLASVAQPPGIIRAVISSCKSSGGVDAGFTQIQQSASGQILFNTVLAGGLSEDGAQDIVPEVDPVFVSDSIDTLTRLFPTLARIDWLRSWVRYEAVTPDDRFLIGPAGPEGLLVAAGDSGVGFVRAPAIGRLIREMIAGAPLSYRADIYDPARPMAWG